MSESIVDLLTSADVGARLEGLILAGSPGQPPDVLEQLIYLLGSTDMDHSSAAAEALGVNHATEAMPLIIEAMDHLPPRESRGHAWAIAKLARESDDERLVDTALEALRRYQGRAGAEEREHADVLLESIAARPGP